MRLYFAHMYVLSAYVVIIIPKNPVHLQKKYTCIQITNITFKEQTQTSLTVALRDVTAAL